MSRDARARPNPTARTSSTPLVLVLTSILVATAAARARAQCDDPEAGFGAAGADEVVSKFVLFDELAMARARIERRPQRSRARELR